MMDFEAKALLEKTFFNVFAQQGYREGVAERVSERYARLRMVAAQETVKAAEGAYAQACERLGSIGHIESKVEGEQIVLATGSGHKNANPAVVELRFASGELIMTAWGKEGLFPQKTAKKAIARVKEALK